MIQIWLKKSLSNQMKHKSTQLSQQILPSDFRLFYSISITIHIAVYTKIESVFISRWLSKKVKTKKKQSHLIIFSLVDIENKVGCMVNVINNAPDESYMPTKRDSFIHTEIK